MGNYFSGTGNTGSKPELKSVPVKGEQRCVCNFRLYIDRRVPDGTGDYEDRGGFWLTVSVWGKRAEHVHRVVAKGMAVQVQGSLFLHTWTDADDETRSELRLDADEVTLVPGPIESVVLKPRMRGEAAEGSTAAAGTGDGDHGRR